MTDRAKKLTRHCFVVNPAPGIPAVQETELGEWVRADEAEAEIKEAGQRGAERVFAALSVHFAGHPDFDRTLADFDNRNLTEVDDG